MTREAGAPDVVVSAGGVVYRVRDGILEVAAIRRARSGRWRLPKGHVQPNETPAQAAVREVREEAGLQAEVVCSLGESRYTYYDEEAQREQAKVVHGFLMRLTSEAEVAPEVGTFDAGGFFPAEGAAKLLHFDNEREAVHRAIELLGYGG
jgi:8-oxo-dGTP pyrophosphatase MutT (NUDIX family)